jgi:hypothetical protein
MTPGRVQLARPSDAFWFTHHRVRDEGDTTAREREVILKDGSKETKCE